MPHIDLLAKDSVRNLIMPISVEQYHQFSESGIISEKTELVEGIIFKKMTKSPLHEFIAYQLYDFFAKRAGDHYLVRKEAPLTLVTSEPEPDISVVKGKLGEFLTKHPSSAELVIEVAVSSVELDRAKATSYAGADIPEYWIVIPDKPIVERYRKPQDSEYQSKEIIDVTDSIATAWGELRLSDLFSEFV